MIQPKKLNPGDQIALVCTARSVEEKDLAFAIELLKKWQLIPVLGSSIGLKHHQFGGTDEQRIKDIQNQINNPEIKAIWCAKGGYGTARIIDAIDFKPLIDQPKWIIGYSDVTALHLHLNHLGIASLHAQMPVDIQHKSPQTIESLRQSLCQKPFNINYTSKFPSRSGRAQGELLGGNLSVLYSILGSASQPNFKDKILFLEDLDEYLYHIDRMMLNLYRSGILNQLKGLIIGGMNAMNDNDVSFGKTAYEIIDDYAKQLHIPVAYDCPTGHTYDNLALTLGAKINLKVNKNKVSIEY